MEILQYGFMQRAFVVGLLLAVITPCIGITIVLKRLSMVGDALSHSSLAGVALGLLLGINPVLGAGALCIVAAFGIEAIRKKIPRYSEMAIAIIMSAGMGWQVCFPVLWKTVRTLTAFYLEVLCRLAEEKCSQYVSSVWQSCLCLVSFPENFSILALMKMRQESPAFRSDR